MIRNEHPRGQGGRWVGALIAIAACASSDATVCPNQDTCPTDTRCVAIANRDAPAEVQGYVCATDDDFMACETKADGATCLDAGVCVGGACIMPTCGNGLAEPGERCDDGNLAAEDGCSADCRSLEVCGDTATDLARGEQCDVGVPGFSGDGCSSVCQLESRLWREVPASIPPARQFAALVPDPLGNGVLLIGGGYFALKNTGFADMWRWDGVTWQEVPQPHAPTPRASAAVAYDDVNHKVVLFGGATADVTPLADTWEWDGVTWTQRVTTQTPPARLQASMACGGGLCVLFGGRLAAPGTEFEDTWVWRSADGTWTKVPGSGPSARWGAALTFAPGASPQFVLYGGVRNRVSPQNAPGPPQPVGETWVLSATTGWRELTPGMIPPGRRTSAVLRGMTHSGQVVIAVELNAAPPPDPDVPAVPAVKRTALWQLQINGTTAHWTLVDGSDTPQLGNVVFDPDPVRNRFVGLDGDGVDIREFQTSTWATVAPADPSTGDAGAIIATYDPLRARTLIVDSTGTWAWNGAGFERLARAGSNAPPALSGASLVYDTACDQAILFGGRTSTVQGNTSTVQGNTWRFKDGAWTDLAIGGPRLPRERAQMTYDTLRARTVLFGGQGVVNNALDDLWELSWDNCAVPTWAEVSPPPSARPPSRAGGTLTYDPLSGVSVLYGGFVPDPNAMPPIELRDDTWVWTGTQWQGPLEPATLPGNRALHGAVFDPASGRVIIMGGVANTAESDTWAFNPASLTTTGVSPWDRVDALVAPRPRRGHALARDRRGIIAIGGEAGAGVEAGGGQETPVRLTSEQPFAIPERCLAADEDLDGDRLAGCADPDCWLRCDPTCAPEAPPAPDAPPADPPRCDADPVRPRCGDGACATGREDYALCPGDCPPPP